MLYRKIIVLDGLKQTCPVSTRGIGSVHLLNIVLSVRIYSRETKREMCLWAISKYFGDLVSNTSA
jgi:hypothetical protein